MSQKLNNHKSAKPTKTGTPKKPPLPFIPKDRGGIVLRFGYKSNHTQKNQRGN